MYWREACVSGIYLSSRRSVGGSGFLAFSRAERCGLVYRRDMPKNNSEK